MERPAEPKKDLLAQPELELPALLFLDWLEKGLNR
jgi:hypothetical protein